MGRGNLAKKITIHINIHNGVMSYVYNNNIIYIYIMHVIHNDIKYVYI